MSAVLDTNLAIHELHGELVERLPERDVLVSVVTEIELLGFPDLSIEEEAGIRALLLSFEIVPLGERVKDETIRLRRAMRLRLPDAIVLATAVVTRSELLTNDRELAAKASAVVSCRPIAMRPAL